MAEVIDARARWVLMAAVALLAAAVAALAASPAKAATPRSFYGLVPNHDLGATDYELMRQANVGSARVTLFWQVIGETAGQYDWADTDRLFGDAASRGITLLPNLYGTPTRLSDETTRPPVDTAAQRSGWENFVREAARRYGQGGTFWRTVYPLRYPGAQAYPPTTWQVWNEENGPKHFFPEPNVGKFVTLLEIAKQALTSVNPDARVLTGGLVSRPTGAGGIDAWKYIKALTKTEAGRNSFDDVGLHPYAKNQKVVAGDVKKVRKALKKGKKKQARVTLTEIGWSSVRDGASPKLSKSPKEQAKLLGKTYKLLAKKRRKWKIGGVYWYTWRDFDGGGICDWCGDAGLVTRDLQPKPAYNKFKQVAG